MKIIGSILDFPRKTLSEDIWRYSSEDKINELPYLKSEVSFLIKNTVEKYLSHLGLEPVAINLYGGAASYQWSENADIDVSIYTEGWGANITEEKIEEYQDIFKEVEIPYKSYVIHFFLKKPNEKIIEVADAVYDVLNDEWILPPLVLPDDFDPEEYFKPFIKNAEKKAEKFDEEIGKLRRSWGIMAKSSEALEQSKEPEIVKKRIEEEKDIIRKQIEWLGNTFIKIRENRYTMHDALREKMEKDLQIGRFERFQEPEIIWKYLDRAGYNDFLWKLYKIKHNNELEKILAVY